MIRATELVIMLQKWANNIFKNDFRMLSLKVGKIEKFTPAFLGRFFCNNSYPFENQIYIRGIARSIYIEPSAQENMQTCRETLRTSMGRTAHFYIIGDFCGCRSCTGIFFEADEQNWSNLTIKLNVW